MVTQRRRELKKARSKSAAKLIKGEVLKKLRVLGRGGGGAPSFFLLSW